MEGMIDRVKKRHNYFVEKRDNPNITPGVYQYYKGRVDSCREFLDILETERIYFEERLRVLDERT